MAVSKQEADWRAEDDARTLMRAREIMGDAKRKKRADKALSKIEEEAKRTQVEAQVAKKLKALGGDGK